MQNNDFSILSFFCAQPITEKNAQKELHEVMVNINFKMLKLRGTQQLVHYHVIFPKFYAKSDIPV